MTRFFDPMFHAQQESLIRDMERRDFVRRHPEWASPLTCPPCTGNCNQGRMCPARLGQGADLEAARRVSDLCAPSMPEPFEPPDEVKQPEVRELHPITAEMLWDAAQEGIRALG